MTKGKNKARKRRAMRRTQKGSILTQDKMTGALVKRRYGGGAESEGKEDRIDYRFDVV